MSLERIRIIAENQRRTLIFIGAFGFLFLLDP